MGSGWTGLHFAAAASLTAAVDSLVLAGAPIDAQTDDEVGFGFTGHRSTLQRRRAQPDLQRLLSASGQQPIAQTHPGRLRYTTPSRKGTSVSRRSSSRTGQIHTAATTEARRQRTLRHRGWSRRRGTSSTTGGIGIRSPTGSNSTGDPINTNARVGIAVCVVYLQECSPS